MKTKKMWNLVVSKLENHNLRWQQTTMKIELDFIKKKNFSFIADTKLKVDQIKRKTEAKFNELLFFKKSNIFKSQNDHKISSNKLDTIIWS